MANVSEMEKEFKEYGKNIRRLKQMESELNNLDTRGYESEERSIRGKLKNPQLADEVEDELDALKRAVGTPPHALRIPSGTSDDVLSKKYEMLEFIGAGGFADVYKARRVEDDLIVALKIPKFDQFKTVDPRAFLREVDIWLKLNHPNIVKVIEFGSKPYPWIAMEYMAKGSSRNMIDKMTLRESIDFTLKLCDALGYTHNNGIFHGDIKPENIMCDGYNNPKLSDWGTGRMMLEHSTTTDKGMTPAYASPEQVNPKEFGKAGWWTDIYQCGAVLYEMVTGVRPVQGENIAEIVWNITQGEVIKPSEIKRGLPKELDEITLKCVAKRRENRYKDIAVVQAALEDLRKTI